MLSTKADSQSFVSIFGFYLAHRVQINVKTTTSAGQLWTHLLNAWEKTAFPEVFAFCISVDLDNLPSSLLLLPLTLALPVFSSSLLTHIQSKYNLGKSRTIPEAGEPVQWLPCRG